MIIRKACRPILMVDKLKNVRKTENCRRIMRDRVTRFRFLQNISFFSNVSRFSNPNIIFSLFVRIQRHQSKVLFTRSIPKYTYTLSSTVGMRFKSPGATKLTSSFPPPFILRVYGHVRARTKPTNFRAIRARARNDRVRYGRIVGNNNFRLTTSSLRPLYRRFIAEP